MVSRYISFYSPILSNSLTGNLIHGNILHIPSLTKNSSGEYECQASNGIEGTVKKKIFISVRGIFGLFFPFFGFFIRAFS